VKRLVADCVAVTLPGCGHFPTMEKPEECARVIEAYLEGRRGLRPA
jgi:pimeloyl-ACP methyl ester carboxylesterase